MTPNDLFKQLKDSINTINDKQLIAFRDNALRLGIPMKYKYGFKDQKIQNFFCSLFDKEKSF